VSALGAQRLARRRRRIRVPVRLRWLRRRPGRAAVELDHLPHRYRCAGRAQECEKGCLDWQRLAHTFPNLHRACLVSLLATHRQFADGNPFSAKHFPALASPKVALLIAVSRPQRHGTPSGCRRQSHCRVEPVSTSHSRVRETVWSILLAESVLLPTGQFNTMHSRVSGTPR